MVFVQEGLQKSHFHGFRFFIDFGFHVGGHFGCNFDTNLAKGVTLRAQGHQKELPKNGLIF